MTLNSSITEFLRSTFSKVSREYQLLATAQLDLSFMAMRGKQVYYVPRNFNFTL